MTGWDVHLFCSSQSQYNSGVSISAGTLLTATLLGVMTT